MWTGGHLHLFLPETDPGRAPRLLSSNHGAISGPSSHRQVGGRKSVKHEIGKAVSTKLPSVFVLFELKNDMLLATPTLKGSYCPPSLRSALHSGVVQRLVQ